MKYNVQKFKLELVREESFIQDYEGQITSPENLHDFFINVCRLHKNPQETVIAIALDIRGNVIGFTTISIGGISSSILDPSTVFRFALCSNACAIAIGHNHPSGDPSASQYEPLSVELNKKFVKISSGKTSCCFYFFCPVLQLTGKKVIMNSIS